MEKIFDQGKEIEEKERPKFLCINKMLAYLLSQFICHINDQISKDSSNIQNPVKILFICTFVNI